MSNKIKCSHILVQKQSEAIVIHERLKNGEKFGKLAKELSIDTGSAKKDGNFKAVKSIVNSNNALKSYGSKHPLKMYNKKK